MTQQLYKQHGKVADEITSHLNQILVGFAFLGGAAAIAKAKSVIFPGYEWVAHGVAWLLAMSALLWVAWICVIGWVRLRAEAPRPILAVIATAPLVFVILLMGRAVFFEALYS